MPDFPAIDCRTDVFSPPPILSGAHLRIFDHERLKIVRLWLRRCSRIPRCNHRLGLDPIVDVNRHRARRADSPRVRSRRRPASALPRRMR